MLKRIVRRAIGALGGTAGMIILWERDGRTVRQAVTIGLRGEQARLVEERLNELRMQLVPILGRVTGNKIDRFLSPQTQSLGVLQHALVLLPLLADGGAFGVIGVVRPAAMLTATEERLLLAFADQAGLSVRNASLAERLRFEEERLRRVIEASTDGIVMCDTLGRILSVNTAMEQMVGVRRSMLIGHRIDEVIDVQIVQGGKLTRGVFGADSLTENVAEVEGVLRARDGTLVRVLLSVVGPSDATAGAEQLIMYVRNVTRLHELEELRSTFLSMTSHELQTPVAIIKAWGETLLKRYGEKDVVLKQALEAIDHESDRLSRLIKNLLRVTRIEAGALPVRLVEISLPELARKVADRFAPRSSRHQIVVEFPEQFPPVQADPERIEEVFSNLIDNAIKYSPNGGTVTISGKVTPSTVEVSVRDEGPGIPLAEQGQLFQRFYRAPGGVNRQTTGVGLGLFLVKAIVEAHGGHLWLESEWGKGSTFHFSLPRGVGPALPQPQDAGGEERKV